MSIAEKTTAGGQSIADRRLRLGASEFAAALGEDPYKSPFALFVEKSGLVAPDDLSEVEHVQWGVNLEVPILQEFAKRTGRIVNPWPQAECVRSPDVSFLSCTPDAMQLADERGDDEGLAQVKNTGEYSKSAWAEGPPLRVQIQTHGECFVTGHDWGSVVVLIGGNKLRYWDFERNDSFIAAMVKGLKEFWERVQNGDPPPADGSAATSRALAKLYPTGDGEMVDFPPEAVDWDRDLCAAKAAIKAAEELKAAAENKIKAAIGAWSGGMLPDGSSYTYNEQTRKEHIVRASTFRVLRRSK